MQLSLFTAAEIDYLSRRHRFGHHDTLAKLREAGLDNINGGGAEIFSERFREHRLPEQGQRPRDWLERSRRGASRMGSHRTRRCCTERSRRSRSDSNTLILLRESQMRSPGYNAFIPLAFHPDGNELSALRLDDVASTTSGCSQSRA